MAARNNYVTDIPTMGAAEVCPPPDKNYTPDQLMAEFPGGIAAQLSPDPATGRIPITAIQTQIALLISNNNTAIKARPMQAVGSKDVAGSETDMTSLVTMDVTLYNAVRQEYCFYEARYRFALTKFLMLSTSGNQSDNVPAQSMLSMSRILNLKLNSILEIMNYFQI